MTSCCFGERPNACNIDRYVTAARKEKRLIASFAVRLTSPLGRFCRKSLQTPGDIFPARRGNKLRSLIDVASGMLPKSPVSLSQGDELPHTFTLRLINLRSTVQKDFCNKIPNTFYLF